MEKLEVKGLDTTIQDISIHDTRADIHGFKGLDTTIQDIFIHDTRADIYGYKIIIPTHYYPHPVRIIMMQITRALQVLRPPPMKSRQRVI